MVMKHNYIKLVHATDSHHDWFVVNWCLGNTCNYSCSYCPKGLHDGSNPWPDEAKIKTFIKSIIDQVSPKKVYFEFTGGEVTLYRNFIDICKYCTELGAKVGLISNGSRTIRWWEENKQYFDHVCLSFHPEFADPDHFKSVVSLLKDDIRTHVNIMMSPEKFDYCFKVAEEVRDIGNISMALQPLIHDFGEVVYDYTSEQNEVFKNQHELITKHIKFTKTFNYYRGAMKMVFNDGTQRVSSGQRILAASANDWSGWKCHAGVEQIVIDMNGNIKRGWCQVGGNIGNILEHFTLPKTPILCNKTMCHCIFDIMCTKEL
jgi:MoaA/NifB/PqqE/SkfB family radical SAM enzyme